LSVWREYISVKSIEDAVAILAERPGRARIVAGATDLILEMEKGLRQDIDTLVDITRVRGLDQMRLDEAGVVHLGPMVTHNQCVGSKLVREHAFPLARAAWEVGSPQIRNRGTVAGNLITASPANDTITPLMALGARLTLRSVRGERVVALEEFYSGVRKTVMQPDEMLVDIAFPAMQDNQSGTFIKLALRRAQAISLVNLAVILTFVGDIVQSARITLGAVAPTIIHAAEAEAYLAGKVLDELAIQGATERTGQAARPISDLRSSAVYRRKMTEVIARRGLQAIAEQTERAGFPEDPVLLRGRQQHTACFIDEDTTHRAGEPIVTRINGQPYTFTTGQDKTLLHLIREEAGLIGSKEGCDEGECGACTVFLDGAAVMSCMVPAPRAHGAEIVTVEGLAQEGHLHPVQSAFIEEGAVQCGYCTPGFLMSAVKLLEEKRSPTQEQIRQALTGNLCRCTGYYKIIKAVEAASRRIAWEDIR
jgi:xanthine dehydrogenase iron-sulfur cluster and FAD-binding subunit A